MTRPVAPPLARAFPWALGAALFIAAAAASGGFGLGAALAGDGEADALRADLAAARDATRDAEARALAAEQRADELAADLTALQDCPLQYNGECLSIDATIELINEREAELTSMVRATGQQSAVIDGLTAELQAYAAAHGEDECIATFGNVALLGGGLSGSTVRCLEYLFGGD